MLGTYGLWPRNSWHKADPAESLEADLRADGHVTTIACDVKVAATAAAFASAVEGVEGIS